MRTVLVSTAALVVDFVTAVAQNAPMQSSSCGQSAMSAKTSQGVG